MAFSLKASPRKRKKKAAGPDASKPQKYKKITIFFTGQISSTEIVQQLSSENFEPSSSSSSSSSALSGASSSSSTPSTSDNESGEEAEVPFRTAEAALEESTVEQLLASHVELRRKRGDHLASASSKEGDGDDQGRNLVAEAMVEDVPPPPIKTSFCNRILGLVEAGVQVAPKLAKCRACSQPIPRHTARFSYSFSIQKWPAWLHPDCVPAYIQTHHGDVDQALTFLQRQGQNSRNPAQVLEAIAKLQHDLNHLER